ncbi:MAG: hypothetical protein IPN29_22130 [Saprospiraceae bacterium]|nr:hypothetical protein [Saprospiraceae bacterium]
MQTHHQKSYCRIFIFLLLSLISFVTTTFAQSKDVKKILAVLRLEEEYWSKGDIEGYVSLYAPLIQPV